MSQLAYEWSGINSLFVVIDVGDIENIQEDENVSKYLLTAAAGQLSFLREFFN